MKSEEANQMEYRNLGSTSIKVSVISFGNWINSDEEKVKKNTIDCVKKAGIWELISLILPKFIVRYDLDLGKERDKWVKLEDNSMQFRNL